MSGDRQKPLSGLRLSTEEHGYSIEDEARRSHHDSEVLMATIEESIDVRVPVRSVYNQWTQFEQFPHFMQYVDSVEQIDNTHLRWTATMRGERYEWEAEITEQQPDQRIAWRATEGKGNAGVVTFHRLDDETTRVMLQLDWQPEGVAEKAAAALGFDAESVQQDLQRFKEAIEALGGETGGWRGQVSPKS